MSRVRLPIAALMVVVAVAALDFAAMSQPSDWLMRAAFTTTFLLLLAATLAARFGRAPHGAWWGFALCGWAYYLSVFTGLARSAPDGSAEYLPPLLTARLLDDLGDRYVALEFNAASSRHDHDLELTAGHRRKHYFVQAGHALCCLAFGAIGGALGLLIEPWGERRHEERRGLAPTAPSADGPPPGDLLAGIGRAVEAGSGAEPPAILEEISLPLREP